MRGYLFYVLTILGLGVGFILLSMKDMKAAVPRCVKIDITAKTHAFSNSADYTIRGTVCEQ